MKLEGSTIAVTGATGFFGAYIAEALLERNVTVRAVVRSPGRLPELTETPNVEVAVADLMDQPALARAFEGVEAVVGNAAMATPSVRGWDDNYLPNKIGTENVLEAMAASGVGRYVHISTIGVYDIPPTKLFGAGPFAEEHPLVTPKLKRLVGAYRVTKALSEQVARDRCRMHRIDLTILRTSATWGHRDPTIVPAVRRYMKWRLLPAPKLVFALVYATDAAEAVAESLARDVASGATYNVAGPQDSSLFELLAAWKRVTGTGPRLLPFPTPVRIAFDSSRAERDLELCHTPIDEAIRKILLREAHDPA